MCKRVDQARERLTCKTTMSDYLNESDNVFDRYKNICHYLIVCGNPNDRFGLKADDTKHMIPFLQELKAEIEHEYRRSIAGARRMRRNMGMSYDDIQNTIDLAGLDKSEVSLVLGIIRYRFGPNVFPCNGWVECTIGNDA